MEKLINVWLKNWRYFTAFAVAGVGLFLLVHVFFNKTEVEAQLISTAPFRGQIGQLPWETQEEGDSDTKIKRELKDLSLWLRSYDFMQGFLQVHCDPSKPAAFCAEFGRDGDFSPSKMMGAIETQIDEGKILRIRVRSKDPGVGSQLANLLASELVEQQEKQAGQEATRMAQKLGKQKMEIERRLRSSIEVLSKSGADIGPTLSADPAKHLGFLSELQSKSAEIDLKISENSNVVGRIKQQARASGTEDDEYGPQLRVQALESENQMLLAKKRSLTGQIKKSLKGQYSKKGKTASLTQLKEQFRVDLENFGALTRALEKVKLSVSVQERRFDVFQKAHPQLARNRWPFTLLLALGAFLSQIFAVGGFLILQMWKTEEEEDRNLFVSPGLTPMFEPIALKSKIPSEFN